MSESWKGRYLYWLNHQLQNSTGDQPPSYTSFDPYRNIDKMKLEISDNPVFQESFDQDDPDLTLFKVITLGSVGVGKSLMNSKI